MYNNLPFLIEIFRDSVTKKYKSIFYGRNRHVLHGTRQNEYYYKPCVAGET